MKMLGVGSTTIKRWADENRLLTVRTAGGHRRFSRADVESFLRQQESTNRRFALTDRWVQMLIDNGDARRLQDEIAGLHDQLGDWFSTAEFLGGVAEQIGGRWAAGDCSVVEEHIASGRLELALAGVSNSSRVANGAPTCLLATLSGEFHSLGLSLARLCLRSAGFDVVWIGVNTPLDELLQYIKTSEQSALGLSASRWLTDGVSLASAYRAVAAACRDQGVELMLGGGGAWPDVIEYGYRCHSFTDLRSLAERIRSGLLSDGENHLGNSQTTRQKAMT